MPQELPILRLFKKSVCAVLQIFFLADLIEILCTMQKTYKLLIFAQIFRLSHILSTYIF